MRKILYTTAIVLALSTPALAMQDNDSGKPDPSKDGNAPRNGQDRGSLDLIDRYGWLGGLEIAAARARARADQVESARERDERARRDDYRNDR